MSLVLNTNLSSMVAQNSLSASGAQLSTSLQQLSSGLRINTAADDAAGYAIVQGMTSQINGITQASQNANDGVSLAQTATGALQEVVNDLQTMRDLAVESLNATNGAGDRSDLDAQFQQLKSDINSVASQTQFNGVNLLDGSFQGATFQVGANAGQTITVASIGSSSSGSLGATYNAILSTAANTVKTAAGATVTTTTAGAAGTYSAANILSGTTGLGTTVAGSTVTLGVTVNGTAYSTGAITLTGVAATDLKSVAAGLNQALSASGNLVATVNAGGTAIQIVGAQSAGTGSYVSTAVTAATDANGNAVAAGVTNSTTLVQALGVDTNDTVGFQATGTAAPVATSAATYLSTTNVKSVDSSNSVLVAIDAALQQLATQSAQIGAYQNRFQSAITGLNTDSTNLTSARSQIQDTDYASATSALSKAQILQQAGTAMVAQANTIPQNILTLLQKLP